MTLVAFERRLPKVFVIGLTRTGTTSVSRALEVLGLSSAHWRNQYTGMLLDWEDFFFFDACADITVSALFEPLLRAFDGARFILTERDGEPWVKSVSWHYDAATPQQLRYRLRRWPVLTHNGTGPEFETTALFQLAHGTLYTAHDTWEAAYAAHHKRVMSAFEAMPERLLRIDLANEPQPWRALCRFLDRPEPSRDFPNVSWTRQAATRAPGTPLKPL